MATRIIACCECGTKVVAHSKNRKRCGDCNILLKAMKARANTENKGRGKNTLENGKNTN